MRQKLLHTQKVLEGVVTSDWKNLEQSSRALIQLTSEPSWQVFATPEYRNYTRAFSHAVSDLADVAERHDLDAATVAYSAVVDSCVSCHKYTARRRIALR
jgi:cytochrome c556